MTIEKHSRFFCSDATSHFPENATPELNLFLSGDENDQIFVVDVVVVIVAVVVVFVVVVVVFVVVVFAVVSFEPRLSCQ